MTLFINACPREDSRTLILARHLLRHISGQITELDLEAEQILPLNRKTLAERDARTDDSPCIRYAAQLRDADAVVIAAPLWDLSIPAALKCYIEALCVTGVTFNYVNGVPAGLCKAKKLYFVTTSGGTFLSDFGYDYVRAVFTGFFGIPETELFYAEGLDIDGADIDGILVEAMKDIDRRMA